MPLLTAAVRLCHHLFLAMAVRSQSHCLQHCHLQMKSALTMASMRFLLAIPCQKFSVLADMAAMVEFEDAEAEAMEFLPALDSDDDAPQADTDDVLGLGVFLAPVAPIPAMVAGVGWALFRPEGVSYASAKIIDDVGVHRGWVQMYSEKICLVAICRICRAHVNRNWRARQADNAHLYAQWRPTGLHLAFFLHTDCPGIAKAHRAKFHEFGLMARCKWRRWGMYKAPFSFALQTCCKKEWAPFDHEFGVEIFDAPMPG